MDMFWFRDLDHLSQTGNFSQAAEMSHISQPAFSRRIKALELWVGVGLVDRRAHPVQLTAAGHQMLEAGHQALLRIESERRQILEAHALPAKYVVTFGAQHSIGWRFYPQWLQDFEDGFGPILSRLRADDLPNCERDLRRGDVDFVIAFVAAETTRAPTGIAADDRLDSVLIGRDRLLPVCTPGQDGGPLFDFSDPEAKVPFLQFGANAPINRHLEPVLCRAPLAGMLQPVYENAMAGALRIRARDGAGVAWLPQSLIAADLENGMLVRTGIAAWEIPLEIRLFRRKNQSNHLTRAIWSYLNSDPSAAG